MRFVCSLLIARSEQLYRWASVGLSAGLIALIASFGDSGATGQSTDLSGATTVQVGSTTSGTLASDTDTDLYKFVLSNEADIGIFDQFRGDTDAKLLDSQGGVLESNQYGRFIIEPTYFYIRKTLAA